jgi:AcrR family transcriptional regulator
MDRRAHYLTVASELFVEHGFHGVSIDQIVATAGGSKATLYRYFESKEALFAAIIDDIVATSAPSTIDDELKGADLETGLRLIATTTANGALHPRTIELLQLAVAEARRFPALAIALFARGPAVNYERLRAFLTRQAEFGTIDVDDPQIAAEQLLGGIVGHQQLRMALGLSAPSRTEIDQRIDAAVASFLASHRPPGRQETHQAIHPSTAP